MIIASSNATVMARIVSLLLFFIALLNGLDIINAHQADTAKLLIESDTGSATIMLLASFINAQLPAVAGWLTKDRELPNGIKITDVQLAPWANVTPEARESFNKAVEKAVGE